MVSPPHPFPKLLKCRRRVIYFTTYQGYQSRESIPNSSYIKNQICLYENMLGTKASTRAKVIETMHFQDLILQCTLEGKVLRFTSNIDG